MKTLSIYGLLSLLSVVFFSWNSAALSGVRAPSSETRAMPSIAAPSPSLDTPMGANARDLSEYVFLHETRNESIPLQIAARANACRGIDPAPRG